MMITKLIAYLAIPLGAILFILRSFLTSPSTQASSPVAAPAPPSTVQMIPSLKVGPTRVLQNVAVSRCDPDGFVVSSAEGTFKVWNQQLTSDAYAKLKRMAPAPTPTPERPRSLLEPASTPSGKDKAKGREGAWKDNVLMQLLKDL